MSESVDVELRSGAAAYSLGDGLVLLRLPDPEPGFPEGVLTPAEEEVARAIFRGSSTEEVAAARGVSAKTISNQLRSIYQKLGVASRAEMAARLVPA